MNRMFVKLLKLILLPFVLLLRILAYLVPRDSRSIAVGAWLGDLFSDSPKYLWLKLIEEQDLKVYWIGKQKIKNIVPVSANAKFVRKDSLMAFAVLLKCKTWVSCQGSWADLTALPIYGRALVVNLWHGIPFKGGGKFAPKNQIKRSRFEKLICFIKDFEYGFTKEWMTVSSGDAAAIMARYEPEHYTLERMLPFGFVRNDYLVANVSNKNLIGELKKKYATMLGVDPNKKFVLYMPTFRRVGSRFFSFYMLGESEQREIKKMLDRENAIIIEKHHYITYRDFPVGKSSVCSVVVPAEMQSDIDVQELYLASDVMIGDYSSAIVEYGLLKRPAIHFAYDLEDFSKNDSGMCYDIRDVSVGPVVQTLDELKMVLQKELIAPNFSPAPGYKKIVEYEQGRAGEQVIKFIRENA